MVIKPDAPCCTYCNWETVIDPITGYKYEDYICRDVCDYTLCSA